jgi:hypothetical protein
VLTTDERRAPPRCAVHDGRSRHGLDRHALAQRHGAPHRGGARVRQAGEAGRFGVALRRHLWRRIRGPCELCSHGRLARAMERRRSQARGQSPRRLRPRAPSPAHRSPCVPRCSSSRGGSTPAARPRRSPPCRPTP